MLTKYVFNLVDGTIKRCRDEAVTNLKEGLLVIDATGTSKVSSNLLSISVEAIGYSFNQLFESEIVSTSATLALQSKVHQSSSVDKSKYEEVLNAYDAALLKDARDLCTAYLMYYAALQMRVAVPDIINAIDFDDITMIFKIETFADFYKHRS